MSFIFSDLKKAANYGKIEYQIKSTKGGIPMAAEKKKAFRAVQAEGCAAEGADHTCRVLYCKQTGEERVGDFARNEYRSISRQLVAR